MIALLSRTLSTLLPALVVATSPALYAQTLDASEELAAANERLHAAMLAPNPAQLDALLHAQLTYGHSSAKVDTKDSLVKALLTGTSKFTRIDFTDRKIDVVGEVATIRYTFDADTHPAGKPPTTVHLQVLSVWLHQPSGWQLLARQAVNQPR
ncbi:nuclear transport factor 2 family protein [Cupriavidus sp. SS-3]|uniref:nuclear transport factor 2 family protein n=1 Tax=Cupriavidus sp. SS-3 TaxID=3109596 RepID=UPI002DBF3E59|nr:nuclear transport factor 2 family protein [Cupriavidus sp. SS-3]MEC3767103.1 nuclear transport factor 2 family protein [Cupriavidus sp. SS-3]